MEAFVSEAHAGPCSEAITDLAADPARRRAMGQAGRAKVEAEFDIDREAIWLKTLFEGGGGDALRPPEDTPNPA